MSGETEKNAFDELEKLLSAIEKEASAKSAQVPEPPSAHPTHGEPDGTRAAPEGAHAQELNTDARNANPGSTNATSEGVNGVQPTTETNSTAGPTGDNVPSTTQTPRDPGGTTHPAVVNKSAEEWAAELDRKLREHGAIKTASALFAEIDAELGEIKIASEAGYVAGAEDVDELTDTVKRAADQAYQDALADSEMFARFIVGLHKNAGDEGIDPAAVAAAPELPVEDLTALTEMAQGVPPEAAVEDEVGEEQLIEALSEALDEAGITPEELVQAVIANGAADETVPMEEKAAGIYKFAEAAGKVEQYRRLARTGNWGSYKAAGVASYPAVKEAMARDVNAIRAHYAGIVNAWNTVTKEAQAAKLSNNQRVYQEKLASLQRHWAARTQLTQQVAAGLAN